MIACEFTKPLWKGGFIVLFFLSAEIWERLSLKFGQVRSFIMFLFPSGFNDWIERLVMVRDGEWAYGLKFT